MRVIFRRLLLYISIPKLLKAPNQGWSLLYLIRKSILSSSKVRKFNGTTEMSLRLTEREAPSEDLGSIPSTYMVTHNNP